MPTLKHPIGYLHGCQILAVGKNRRLATVFPQDAHLSHPKVFPFSVLCAWFATLAHADPGTVTNLVLPLHAVDLLLLEGETPPWQLPDLALAVADHVEARSDQPREELGAEAAAVEDHGYTPILGQ